MSICKAQSNSSIDTLRCESALIPLIRRAATTTVVTFGVILGSSLLPASFGGAEEASANMSCNNTFHLHWGAKHVASQRVQVSGGEVRYWWSFTWAGTGQRYIGSIFCPD